MAKEIKTKLKSVSICIISISLLFILGLSQTFAAQEGSDDTKPPQTDDVKIGITLDNPFKGGDSLFALLRTIVNEILLPIGGILAVLAFIYSGFLYVTAQGNESKIATAHKALLYTAIGTALLLGAWVFANVICQTIGQLGGPRCEPIL